MLIRRQETKTIEVVTDTVCDLCGLSINEREAWPDGGRKHDRNLVTIEHQVGRVDRWGIIDGEALKVDCCPLCWSAKVLPFLKSIGLKREYREIEI